MGRGHGLPAARLFHYLGSLTPNIIGASRMQRMSKTAALRIAAAAVSEPQRAGRGEWVVYSPYYPDNPKGPRSEHRCQAWWNARRVAMQEKVAVALAVMGLADRVLGYDVHNAAHRGGSARAVLTAVLAKIPTTQHPQKATP